MYDKEIVNAIYMNHKYEYCIANHHLEVLRCSDKILKYCDEGLLASEKASIFDIVPELVGMEEELEKILAKELKDLVIPLVHKEPDEYINIQVYLGAESNSLIVLFENITEMIHTQQHLSQTNNENMLLLNEIATKNRQLEQFNFEMQGLVDEEVEKNLEKQYMIELQTRHAQMGEMIAMITHQWKQPLSVIQALGSLLKMKYELGSLTPNLFTEKMDNLLNQAMHMSQTVVDFQKFFTPSNEKVLFDVKETILKVLDLIQMEYELQNISIEVIEDRAVSIVGYENQYTQVILAILQNAKDALVVSTQNDRCIVIRIEMKDERALVTISDNAGGIPNEIIGTIFTQYMTTKEKGSGLGLHIAKSVIENNMQGDIWVHNIEGGAEFSIFV